MPISIEFRSNIKEGREWLGLRACEQIAKAVLRRVSASSARRTLSVVMVGPSRMATLARHRGKHVATDILAFDLDAPMLGEIFLCPPVIAKRARQWGRTPAAHARALFVHGLLHLLGYDHERKDDAEEMETLEQQILRNTKFQSSNFKSNPKLKIV